MTCSRCRRTSSCANPVPKRHEGEYLKFTAAASAECLSCRNYFNSCCKAIQRDVFLQSLEDDVKRAEYMESLTEFEAMFNEASGKQLRKVDEKIKMPEFINFTLEQTSDGRLNLGVF